MEKMDKNKFKPIENVTFEIIAINKVEDSTECVYDLKFNNYKTEKDVIVLNVRPNVLNIIGKDLKTKEEIDLIEVGKNYIFDIIPNDDILINTIRMLFLEMCYGARTQYDDKPYKNSHIAFVSTVYRTLNMCVSNLFHGDYDLAELYKDIYDQNKTKRMKVDEKSDLTSIHCYF